MPTMKVLLLLLLTCPVFSQSIDKQLDSFKESSKYTDHYDNFAKETQVAYQTTVKSGLRSLDLTVMVVIPDAGERSYLFSLSDNHTLYDYDSLKFLLDGETLEIARRSRIDYTANFWLSPGEWRKIVTAKKVEMQLIGFGAIFNDKLLTALHNLDSIKQTPH